MAHLQLGGVNFETARPHPWGVVILGVAQSDPLPADDRDDYLHRVLLADDHRESFFDYVQAQRLVVCKNVRSESPTYRPVKGKSSANRLSPAEYYHHDGMPRRQEVPNAQPRKPRFDEIRLPHQAHGRDVATAVAPFANVVRAQLQALPDRLLHTTALDQDRQTFLASEPEHWPSAHTWEQAQGRVTRLVRKEMDAESARAYFRQVDRLADAYDLPWEMGESRIMLNDHPDLAQTVQHRRAYQAPRNQTAGNGSLVKRWTAEEL